MKSYLIFVGVEINFNWFWMFDDIVGYSGEVVSVMKVFEFLLCFGLLVFYFDEW